MHELCIRNIVGTALFDFDWALISHRYIKAINQNYTVCSIFQRLVCFVSEGEEKVTGIGAYSQTNN